MSGSAIGMMDKAYFVGRKEILTWLNDTFSLNLQKIEETASGAVACQIMDAIYGDVPMSKVKWDAKTEYEFIGNYKVLQSIFSKKKIEKHIDVQKLIRAKYQDNLEFMQWMKNFYELNSAGGDYDAVTRRSKGKGVDRTPITSSSRKAVAAKPSSRDKAAAAAPPRAARAAAAPKSGGGGASHPPARAAAPPAGAANAEVVDELKQEVAELRLSVDGLEKERDFYFGKLRDIEILLQAYGGKDKDLVGQVFKILYATEDDFEPVEPNDGDEEQEQVPEEEDLSPRSDS